MVSSLEHLLSSSFAGRRIETMFAKPEVGFVGTIAATNCDPTLPG
jgi:hypothetical protein